MKIRISEKLMPFSHLPGTRIVLPGSVQVVTAYPTLFQVNEKKIPLNLSGPVKGFTVQLDLERGCVWVWGTYREGYRRFCLWSETGSFRMEEVRGPNRVAAPAFTARTFERLSLGSHKKQDWCLVKRRADMQEVVPHWLRLAQLIPSVEPHSEGAVHYLHQIPKDKSSVLDNFRQLFLAGFDGILCPRLEDSDHLGLSFPPICGNPSPLWLISAGANFLRSLFIEVDRDISVLPCLPTPFHCGRMISIDLGKAGTLDMEWSKKIIRRVVFHSDADQEKNFIFQKAVKSFRLRKVGEREGRVVPAGQTLSFSEGSIYYFDCFQK